jgi:outer membrane immunogenic protein
VAENTRIEQERTGVEMSFSRVYTLKLVGALALVAALPAAAAAQSSNTNDATPAPAVSSAPAPRAVQPPAPYRWSGVYFGGIVAPAWAKVDVATSVVDSPTGYFASSSVTSINEEGVQTLRPNAIAYGGEAGYDFQVARVLFGGSFDFSVMTMNDFVTSGATYPCCAPTSYAITQTIETNWLMTARARAGWILGRRTLIFGTFGIAWMDLRYHTQFNDNFAAATESATADELVNGWIYGGGVEYRLTRNLSVKGEYLFGDFDPISVTSTNLQSTGGAHPTDVFTHTANFQLNVAKGSIKFRF